MPRPLVLASASPRRLALLHQIGLDPLVRVSEVDETLPSGLDAHQAVIALAQRKARAAAQAHALADGENPAAEGAVILGADTLVVLDGEPLGKPNGRDDAAQMLRRLAGRSHQVVTGVALVDTRSKRQVEGVATTTVWMRAIADEEIAAYVATGEPLDKAGAYAIQGGAAVFIERIEGDYSNVVGLPLYLVDRLLGELSGRR